MGPELLSLLVLLSIFVIGTVLPINLGALGYAAAFVIGNLVLNIEAAEIVRRFPSDLFLLLVGITYLFGMAETNGTIDRLVAWAVLAVRGRVGLLLWVLFFIPALLTSIGALLAVGIVCPIAMRFASRSTVNPLLVGMMVVHGALAGSFSPISVYGGLIDRLLADSGLHVSTTLLFLGPLFFNLAIGALIYGLLGRGAQIDQEQMRSLTNLSDRNGHQAATAPGRIRRDQIATMAAIVALAIGTAAFRLNVGLLSISLAAFVALMSPQTQKHAVDKVSWSTVLLVTGMLTYVGVLESIGTIDYVSQGIATLRAPLLAALLLCIVAGASSAFASSIAIMGVMLPLAIPFLQKGHVSANGLIAALAIATTVVDVSPFSTNGALVLASAPDGERVRVYRQMLIYSVVVVVLGPLLAWAVFVATGLF